jgi:hypothetical protein
MEGTEPENTEENNNRKKKKAEKDLSSCTTAPDAEHARAHNEDEPCDDSRSGGFRPGSQSMQDKQSVRCLLFVTNWVLEVNRIIWKT